MSPNDVIVSGPSANVTVGGVKGSVRSAAAGPATDGAETQYALLVLPLGALG